MISLVTGEALTLEGPTIIRFGGAPRGAAVTFPTGTGFEFGFCVTPGEDATEGGGD
jgi:hypothetical protein